jgi:hypothetical protein
MSNKHYVGEAGTSLILDTGVLIGSATAYSIKYLKPGGVTSGSWSASLYSSYSALASATGTYLLSRTLLTTDFDVPGEWKFQAFIGAIDGTWFGETVKENIYGAFE